MIDRPFPTGFVFATHDAVFNVVLVAVDISAEIASSSFFLNFYRNRMIMSHLAQKTQL